MNLTAIESALCEELPSKSVQNLEGFPCADYSEFLAQHKEGQLQVRTRYDSDAFLVLADSSERILHYLLICSPFLVSIALILAAFIRWNFWLLLGVPLAVLGFLLTTPGLMRKFGYGVLLLVGGFAVGSWSLGNRTAAYVLGAYVVSNFLVDVARQQCDMVIREAIEKSEIVLVWLCIKSTVVVNKRDWSLTNRL